MSRAAVITRKIIRERRPLEMPSRASKPGQFPLFGSGPLSYARAAARPALAGFAPRDPAKAQASSPLLAASYA